MRHYRPHPRPPWIEYRVAASTAGWSQAARNFRTCWYCGTTYLTADDATACELAFEEQPRPARPVAL